MITGTGERYHAQRTALSTPGRLGLLDFFEDQGLTLTTVVADPLPRGELLQGVDPVVAKKLLQVFIPDPIAVTDDLSHDGQDIASQ
ncbi:MAG: hypothetical protein RL483_1578 [Pseudomonadota bacterium]